MVVAAVLGGGVPAFEPVPIPPLRLTNTRRREGSDSVVLLRYTVLNDDA